MLYLGIFVLPDLFKIKFHGDRPSRKSIWTNLDPKSSFFFFFAIFGRIFFPFFVPLAGSVVLCQCHSIAHVLALYFLIKADLSDLTRQDKKDPGQNGSRTRWIQDITEPGQNGSRTLGNHQDNREDNREP